MSIKVILNQYRATLSGKYPVVVQLIFHRRRALIYTGVKVYPEEFNKKTGTLRFVRGKSESRKSIRQQCRQIAHVYDVVQSVLSKVGETSPIDSRTVAALCRRRLREHTLYALFEKAIEEKLSQGRIGTAQAYQSTYNKIRTLTSHTDVSLERLSPHFWEHLCARLTLEDCSRNTQAFYHRNLRAVINRYCNSSVETRISPDFSFKGELTHKRALSVSDMEKLVSFHPSTIRLQKAKDLFLLCFFLRGVGLADICFMLKTHRQGDYLSFHRHKTAVPLSIQLTNSIRFFLERYGSRQPESPYLFHFLDGAYTDTKLTYQAYRALLKRTNTALKEVGEILDLPIPLTSYVARHTWATQAKGVGVSLAHISEALGHRSQRITAVYLKSFDQEILDNLNNSVLAPYRLLLEEEPENKKGKQEDI